MAVFMTYRSTSVEAQQHLLRVGARARDLRPVLEDLGERMVEQSIPANFAQGGRPNAWPGTRRGGVLQRDTGGLLDSITYELSGATLRVGTNRVYAAQRHFGGILRPTNKRALAIPLNTGARPRRPQHYGDRLRWAPGKKGKNYGPYFKGFLVEKTGRGPRAKRIYRFILLTQVEQPARPFLLFQPDDVVYGERALVAHLVQA